MGEKEPEPCELGAVEVFTAASCLHRHIVLGLLARCGRSESLPLVASVSPSVEEDFWGVACPIMSSEWGPDRERYKGVQMTREENTVAATAGPGWSGGETVRGRRSSGKGGLHGHP